MAAPAAMESESAWHLKLMRRVDRWVGRVSMHRTACCLFVVVAAFSLRLVLAPVLPDPKPSTHDEFSYLLAGETFAKGRLANPPHPLAEFFETYHVNLHPTYASKYPPGQGMFLALGIALTGKAWYGVLFSISLMCGLVCWAIQGWLRPRYGLYGGLFILLIFGLDHYWVNSYWGGAVAACGGALVLGAMPRLARRPGPVAGMAAACGIVILANSRPFEGLVFVLGCCVAFLWWVRGRRYARQFLRPRTILPAVLILVAGAGWMAYYNHAVTGSFATMPYSINQRQYAAAPAFWILPPLPPAHRVYRDETMRYFWEDRDGWDNGAYIRTRNNPALVLTEIVDLARDNFSHGAGAPLGLAILIAVAFAWTRKTAVVLIMLGVSAVSLFLERFIQVHYAAPVIPVVLLLAMQGMRMLSLLSIRRYRLGLGLTALMMTASVTMATRQILDHRQYLTPHEPQNAVEVRWAVESELQAQPGQHVVVVRYSPTHSALKEIVYNGPDIDAQKIVWAIDKGPLQNRRLIDYYRGRHIWLLDPDPPGFKLAPYPND